LFVLHVSELVVEGTKQEHDRREPLLAVDDLELTFIVFEGDDGPEEILVGAAVELLEVVVREREGEQVIPQR